MFSWICPQCGRDVPPAYSECPDCSKKATPKPPAAAAPPPPVARQPMPMPDQGRYAAPPVRSAPTPDQGQYAAPPQQAPPPYAGGQGGYAAPLAPPYVPPQQQAQYPQQAPMQGQYAPQPGQFPAQPPSMPYEPSTYPGAPAFESSQPLYAPYAAHRKPALPGWLVTLGVALALGGGGALFYSWLGKRSVSVDASSPALEAPAVPTPAAGVKPNKLARHLEVTGVRILEDNKKPQVRVMLVNHSGAEMTQLAGTVSLTTTTAKAGADPIAAFPFTVANIGPYEAREITAPLKTRLRAYEMPDWQFLKAELALGSAE